MLTTLGHISLNISFGFYLIFYFPQLIHNLKQKNILELSLLTHFILCTATIADLIYGFGRDMQWQYCIVTIIGLMCLTIQHIQICYHTAINFSNKLRIVLVSCILLSALLATIYFVTAKLLTMEYSLMAGIVAQIGLLTFTIPQIIKNYQDSTTIGLSIYFVLLNTLLNVCDSITAWTLNWDFPSKIGSPLALILNGILLWQFWWYKKQQDKLHYSFNL